MGVVANEPSMEDILSSIKRIIADGSDGPQVPRASRRRAAVEREEESASADGISDDVDADDELQESGHAILELTDMVEEPTDMTATAAPARKSAAKTAPQTDAPADQILSDSSAQAARESLNQLSSLLVRPQEGEANTLEAMVREMLRPMLKDWLEAKLPELVEGMVKKEIDRIVGRLG